jgi:AhpD family alkylhydroperoxidase
MMESRMSNPAVINAAAMKALYALKGSTEKLVPERTLLLVELRASQINGCSVCVDMHSRQLRKAGETDERMFTLAAWRETPYFNDAERAALDLTEALTQLRNGSESVTDATWEEARRHYGEEALAALIIAIANINVWNRLNIATRQMTGAWVASF